jgi:anti-sigma regulatory factor (Ser/Thr protein kinase)
MLAATAAAETRRFPAKPDAVPEMDRWIEFVGERWGLDHGTLFRARVCVSELANNVLEHGGVSQDRDSMTLALSHTPPGVEIQLSDTGAAFNPVSTPVLDLGQDHVGRRGLRIVRSYAHVLSYRRDHDSNIVTIHVTPTAG